MSPDRDGIAGDEDLDDLLEGNSIDLDELLEDGDEDLDDLLESDPINIDDLLREGDEGEGHGDK